MLRSVTSRSRGRGLRLWLLAAGAAVLLAAAGPAHAEPFAYVTNVGSANVSQFDLGAGGLLAPLVPSTVATGDGPRGVVVSPDGRSVYVATTTVPGTVHQYDVGSGGALSPKTPPAVSAGSAPFGVAVSPDGESVYLTNHADGTVSQYDVGAGGALSLKSPASVLAGHFPFGVAVRPDGGSVYVVNEADGTVSQYNVGSGGTLAPKSPPTVAASGEPSGVAVSPDGKSVYVTNGPADTVSQYDVGAGGVLSPKSPPTVSAGTGPFGVAVSLDGRSVYVTNARPRGNSSISQYDVGAGGALSPKSPPTVFTGQDPLGVTVSPDGGSVYVAISLVGVVSQYDVGAGGALTPKSPPTVAAGDFPSGVAVSPLPRASRTLFGKTTVGTAFAALDHNDKYASPFGLFRSTPATVTKLRAYLDGKGRTRGSQVLRGLIYRNTSNGPGALVAASAAVRISAGRSAGWVDFQFSSPPALSGGVYWLGLHAGDSERLARYAYDEKPGGQRRNDDAFSNGPLNPFGGSDRSRREISIQAVGG